MTKRNVRSPIKFRRRNLNLADLSRVLIITEGTNTEPSYFRKLRSKLEIPAPRVQIRTSNHSTPESVVAKLNQVLREENEFDFIFCLFDRDSHCSFTTAIGDIQKLDKKTDLSKIVAIPSIPCFEIWFLLHAVKSTKPYGMIGSPCDDVIEDLKNHSCFSNYSKTDCGSIFGELSQRTKTAIENAKSGLDLARLNGSNPYEEDSSSRVYLVVEELYALKEKVKS